MRNIQSSCLKILLSMPRWQLTVEVELRRPHQCVQTLQSIWDSESVFWSIQRQWFLGRVVFRAIQHTKLMGKHYLWEIKLTCVYSIDLVFTAGILVIYNSNNGSVYSCADDHNSLPLIMYPMTACTMQGPWNQNSKTEFSHHQFYHSQMGFSRTVTCQNVPCGNGP